jgi:hypothetical protein
MDKNINSLSRMRKRSEFLKQRNDYEIYTYGSQSYSIKWLEFDFSIEGSTFPVTKDNVRISHSNGNTKIELMNIICKGMTYEQVYKNARSPTRSCHIHGCAFT